MLLSPPAINGSRIHTVCEFRGSVYWVAFIGVAFIANTSTTLIADATNCKLCPIIAFSNNWTLQALAAGYLSEVGGVRSWGPSVGVGYKV